MIEDLRIFIHAFQVLDALCEQTPSACRRKTVHCALMDWPEIISTACNGPSQDSVECTGETGGCGCSHAEPRALMDCLHRRKKHLILFCKYSPCTTCANLILDSKIVRAVCYDIFTEHDPRGVEILCSRLPVLDRDELRLLHGRMMRRESIADLAETIAAVKTVVEGI